MNNVSVLINSCDKYNDVVELNLCAFKEYWPDCSYPIFINTETIKYNSNIFNINSINSKFDSWGKRFLNCLNKIDSDLVLVVYDDYILEKKVKTSELNKIVVKMSNNNQLTCFYLKHTDFHIKSDKENDLFYVENSNYYQVNSGPALWRRKDLISLLNENDDPWSWEFFAMYRKSAEDLKFCSVPNSNENIYEYNHIKGGAVYRGKWVEDVVLPKIQKYNLNINIEERGKINLLELSPRSFSWKVKYFANGFKMVGFRSFNLFIYFFKEKFLK
jgi:hypothetical protein